MTTRLIIFDLDGTLVDSLRDIADSVNAVLHENGLPMHPIDAYRAMVGDGLAKLVERAIDPGPDSAPGSGTDFARVLAAVRERYAAHCLDATRPYPGIPALLDALAARRLPLAVLSNKPHAMTIEVVARTFPEGTFVAVAGARESVPIKPDPAAALAIARQLGVPPESTLFVGDTPVDIATARAARMTGVGVHWGFRSAQQLREAGARHLLDAPERLMDLLDAPDV